MKAYNYPIVKERPSNALADDGASSDLLLNIFAWYHRWVRVDVPQRLVWYVAPRMHFYILRNHLWVARGHSRPSIRRSASKSLFLRLPKQLHRRSRTNWRGDWRPQRTHKCVLVSYLTTAIRVLSGIFPWNHPDFKRRRKDFPMEKKRSNMAVYSNTLFESRGY